MNDGAGVAGTGVVWLASQELGQASILVGIYAGSESLSYVSHHPSNPLAYHVFNDLKESRPHFISSQGKKTKNLPLAPRSSCHSGR